MLRLNSFVLGNIMRSCTFHFQKRSQEQQSEKEICVQNCQGNLLLRYAFWETTWHMNVAFVSGRSSLALLGESCWPIWVWFLTELWKWRWEQDLNAGGLWPRRLLKAASACVSLTLFLISFVWFSDCLAAFFFKVLSSWPMILCR